MVALPCRSCQRYSEKTDGQLGGMPCIVEVRCSRNRLPDRPEFAVYGAANQAQGQAILACYAHDENAW